MLFILDTCEGLSLWDHVEAENIYFVSSSKKEQKASSTEYDMTMMAPLSDKFHNLMFRRLKEIYDSKKFDFDLRELFVQLQREKAYLDSDVSIIDRLGKQLLFSDYFGNPNSPNSQNQRIIEDLEAYEKFGNDFIRYFGSIKHDEEKERDSEAYLSELNEVVFDTNKSVLDYFHKVESEIAGVNKYQESTYHLGEEEFKESLFDVFLQKVFQTVSEQLYFEKGMFTAVLFLMSIIFILLK